MELIKAQLSRTKERIRRPYDRLAMDVPRTFIAWGTTNEVQFLKPSSGVNRRFLPVTVGRIDIDRILADRDQLWAEAKFYADSGESCMLPEHLWQNAFNERQAFTQSDPWEEDLRDISVSAARDQFEDYSDQAIYQRIELSSGEAEERIASAYVMDQLNIPTERRTSELAKRAANVMRDLGWKGPQSVRINGSTLRGSVRKEPQPWD